MSVKPVPEGYHTLTPYLVVPDAKKVIAFLQQAFGAKLNHLTEHEGRVMHADLTIGDSHVMMGEANDKWHAAPAGIMMYVPDCDTVYAKALAAGGESLMAPADQMYGDRNSGVKDPAGNTWWICTHVEDVSEEEFERRLATQSQ